MAASASSQQPRGAGTTAAFADLRAEGGHAVSARRANNATIWLRVVAGRDGPVRIRDNFGGRSPQWNRPEVKHVGDHFEIALNAGQTLEATLPQPEAIPPAPADVAPDLNPPKSAAATPPQP
jgi:alpha-L-fucosidase 2